MSYSNYFPYQKIRKEQKEIIKHIEENIGTSKHHIYIESPAGSGKTAAVLSPVLQYIKTYGGQVYWLSVYKRIYENLFNDIMEINRNHSSEIMLSSLQSKESMCLINHKPNSLGFYEFCDNLREKNDCSCYNNTYFKVKDKPFLTEEAKLFIHQLKQNFMEGLYETKDKTWAMKLKEICQKDYPFFCPYEIMKALISQSDVFAGDYNYVFLRGVNMVLNKEKESVLNRILVIDEADKLYDRLMNQSLVLKLSLGRIKGLINYIDEMKAKATKINHTLLADYIDFLWGFLNVVEKYLEMFNNKKDGEITKISLINHFDKYEGFNYYRTKMTEIIAVVYGNNKRGLQLDDFFNMWDSIDESKFTRLIRTVGKPKRKVIGMYPLSLHDTPIWMDGGVPVTFADVLKQFTNVIFVSATLDSSTLKKRFGLEDFDNSICEVNSYHIPSRNYKFIIAEHLNSLFKNRGKMCLEYAKLLVDLLEINNESKIVVFGVNKQMIKEIEKEFKNMGSKFANTSIKWAVVRGSESRGIDMQDYNICAIAGFPYPPQDILEKKRFQKLVESFGVETAWKIFNFDIIKEVIQSFCRVLRQPEDKALIILGDYRFSNFEKMFPHFFRRKITTVCLDKAVIMCSKFFINYTLD